ncbi:MAG TPA: HD domain-containing protein [Puia sp.]|jgi:phosphonate degradation associated HDIG domain protein|nr:HD domain-containing protein [Puia sp.]
MKRQEAEQISNEIIHLYSLYGGEEYSGEKVSQLEHMVQSAQLAKQEGFGNEVVLAAFLHDIGHIAEKVTNENSMSSYGIKDHEAIGASFLEDRGFSFKVTRLVASHVAAKRYLTLREPGYYDKLSEASKRTLDFQGGPMSDEEADLLEEDPLFREIIQMRRWDEAAKLENQTIPSLDIFKELIFQHLQEQQD